MTSVTDQNKTPYAPDADQTIVTSVSAERTADHSDTLRLFAEDVAVTRETEETGRVRVGKVTRTRDHLIDEMLARHSVEVQTVPVGRNVDAIPAVKDDGETMIIPVVEEIVVVERRLFLKEEIHVRRVLTNERHQETVQLRYQEAVVTRIPADASTPAAHPAAGATGLSNQGDR